MDVSSVEMILSGEALSTDEPTRLAIERLRDALDIARQWRKTAPDQGAEGGPAPPGLSQGTGTG